MTAVIPLTATPSQEFSVTLGNQLCRIKVYQKSTGLFLDLFVSDRPIVQGALCRDRVRIVRHAYLGFVGDLAFIDTMGRADPEYAGLGDRFQLGYIDG